MDNVTKIAVSFLVGVILVLGAFTMFRGEGKPFAAAPGPDRFSPCESTDGITSCFKRVALKSATTTVCAIQSPAATSTLVSATVKITTSTTTATDWTLAKAATAYATTTPLNLLNTGASVQGTLAASSTPLTAAGAVNGNVFAPSQWLVLGANPGQVGVDNLAPVGICQATFEVI